MTHSAAQGHQAPVITRVAGAQGLAGVSFSDRRPKNLVMGVEI